MKWFFVTLFSAAVFNSQILGVSAEGVGQKNAPGTYESKPVAIEMPKPKYPRSAAQRGEEGWTLASFVVQVDGSIRDIEITDSSGNGKFDKASREALANWKFKPATLNGQPVESCRSQYQITYAMDYTTGAKKWFVRKYKEIAKQFEAKNYSAALQLVSDIENGDKGMTMYEATRLNLIKGEILSGLGRTRESTKAIHAALRGHAYIEDDAIERAYIYMLMAKINLKQYGDAYSTYKKLSAHSKEAAEDPVIAKAGRELAAVADGTSPFATDVSIDHARGSVSHTLMRREIGFSDIQGKLDRFKFFCDRQYFSAAVNTEETWKLPESWGECSLSIYGEPGTTFKVAEY